MKVNKENRSNDVYTAQGYTDREDYLESLADERGIDPQILGMMADMLGPSEDFDGLVSEIDDYQSIM